MFWRDVLALCQGLNRQYETWDFQLSHGFFWDIPFLLCHAECMGSVEICLRSAVGEMWWKSQQLPVCLLESPVCIVKFQEQLGQIAWVCGFPAISVSYRNPWDLLPDAEPRVWSQGTVWRILGLLVFTDRMRISCIFPQAGHGSKNPCLKGKIVFSQGVWAPCDHSSPPSETPRAGCLLLAFCIVGSVKMSSWVSANSTSVLGKDALLSQASLRLAPHQLWKSHLCV